MKYTYNNKKTIIREEDNGKYLLIGEGAKYDLVINETGKDIYDVLSKYQDMDDIIEHMHGLYPSVDVRVLKKDIFEILKGFEIYGIIDIEDEQTNVTDVEFVFNGDIYYKNVHEFIVYELDRDGIHLCSSEKDYYSILSMRTRVMQNREFEIFARAQEGICAYAAVTCSPVSISKVLVINELILKDGLKDEEVLFYINGLINKAYRLYVNQTMISKVRISMYDSNINTRLVKILEQMGFQRSVCLEDETALGNLYFYDYFLVTSNDYSTNSKSD